MNLEQTYIFTEIIRCAKIGFHAINSFHKMHNLKLHIWCSTSDVQLIPDNSNNILHLVEENSELYKDFDSGHKGTSHLWTKLILELPEEYTHIIHFDSDVVFRGDIINDVNEKLLNYDLVGPIRPYKNNPNNRDDIRHLHDVVQTYCFGFNRSLITMKDKTILWNWVRGYPVQFSHGVIDFFDPVSFHIIYNGGKIYNIDSDVIGGINTQGTRINKYSDINDTFDVGDKIIHFASVGSGLNFTNLILNKTPIYVPKTYVEFAIKRYDLYSKIFYDNKILINNENDHIVEKIKCLLQE